MLSVRSAGPRSRTISASVSGVCMLGARLAHRARSISTNGVVCGGREPVAVGLGDIERHFTQVAGGPSRRGASPPTIQLSAHKLVTMCGIVGYVGNRDSIDVLMNGLRRLEYRGYDSAGVAVIEIGRAHV